MATQASKLSKSTIVGTNLCFQPSTRQYLAHEDTCLVACPERAQEHGEIHNAIHFDPVREERYRILDPERLTPQYVHVLQRPNCRVQVHQLSADATGGGSCYSNDLSHQHLPNNPSNLELSRQLPSQSHVQCLLICQE